jgi:uncharacterized membrane protein YhfC
MLGLPIALAVYIQRRWRPGWALLGIGALTFVVVQVLTCPCIRWLCPASGFLI